MNLLIATHPLERKTITVLLAVLGILVLLYAYLIASIVFNVAARKNNEQQFVLQNAQVGELEAQYLVLRNTILQDRDTFALQDVHKKRYFYLTADRKLTRYDTSGF